MFYLLSYDVKDDRRRYKVMKFLKELGYHMQKSVFILDCSERSRAVDIYQKVKELVSQDTDRVLMAPLCNQCFEKMLISGECPKFAETTWIV